MRKSKPHKQLESDFDPTNGRGAPRQPDVVAFMSVLARRQMLVSSVVGVAAVCSGVAAWVSAGNSKPQLFEVVRENSGRVQIRSADLGEVSWIDANLHFFATEWVEHLWSINITNIEQRQQKALRLCAGRGLSQVTEWLKAENPRALLRDTPNYLREAEVLAVNAVNKDTLIVRLREDRWPGGSAKKSAYFVVTLQYQLERPTEVEELRRNPMGLKIVGFSNSMEIQK
jgi:type IV secretory pathway TrbF-like protein